MIEVGSYVAVTWQLENEKLYYFFNGIMAYIIFLICTCNMLLKYKATLLTYNSFFNHWTFSLFKWPFSCNCDGFIYKILTIPFHFVKTSSFFV